MGGSFLKKVGEFFGWSCSKYRGVAFCGIARIPAPVTILRRLVRLLYSLRDYYKGRYAAFREYCRCSVNCERLRFVASIDSPAGRGSVYVMK
jgi:hypothetical protein